MRLSVTLFLAGLALLGVSIAEGVRAHPAEGPLDDRSREGAARAARMFATLAAHMRASSADQRFADRLAADEPVVAEILADIAWAQHAGISEHPQLIEFRVTDARAVAPDVVELRAREYWVTKTRRGDSAETIRSDVTAVRYALRREGGEWRVADWALDLGEPTAGRTGP